MVAIYEKGTFVHVKGHDVLTLFIKHCVKRPKDGLAKTSLQKQIDTNKTVWISLLIC